MRKSYRKHHQSKRARIAHTKRVKQRKKKFGGLAAFAYDSAVGVPGHLTKKGNLS